MKSQSDIFSLIDAQKEIVDYWNSRREDGLAPLRADIDPGALRAHLHCISILELDGQGGANYMVYKLTGSDANGVITTLSDADAAFAVATSPTLNFKTGDTAVFTVDAAEHPFAVVS